MNKLFETQYNKTANQFNELYLNQVAHRSTNAFFDCINPILSLDFKNRNVLDLGCGAGADAEFYAEKGFLYFGVDASKEMCDMAVKNTKVAGVKNETFSEKISYEDKRFGLIVSKYAMQTAEEISPIYENAARLLDDKGYFVFLVVHPFRQFLEKKKQGKDYFKQEFVESVIFDGELVVTEPTHTLGEYFSKFFLENFDLIEVKEGYDFPASEQIGGDIYPTYLIVVARKK